MVLRMLGNGIVSILLLAQLYSCADKRPKVQADPAIQNSFSIVDKQSNISGAQLGMTDLKRLSIKKDALDKEFLLQASLMRQVPIPTANGLKSRVVAFKRTGNFVFLMEATQGHVISQDLPSQLILAKLPVLSESETDVVLDFGQGMAEAFVSGDWTSSDGGIAYAKSFRGLDIKASFIEDITFHGNALSIRQIAQVAGTQLDTVEVKYYLEPYGSNEGFQSTRGQPVQKFGFFEVAPQYQSSKGNGALDVYASKWDVRKPVIYAISANTPADYVQAVKDGILYWNRALPGAPLQAVVAPAGITAPNYDYNVVQWVPWDTAGYAYADAQMDPRTGEIRHAQIFMTSTFAVSGESRAKALLKKVPSKTKVLNEALSIAGMIQEPLCNFEMQENFFAAMENLLASNAPDSEYLRISQDYIREVVAHEVGHTLGLRHNFAGSLEATYDLAQRPAIVRDYIASQKIPQDLQPSSSVMEYQVFEESAMTGHIIGKTSRILDYDQKVIAALYSGTTFSMDEVPAFCTDSQTDHWDCQTFDLGKNPIDFIAWSIQQERQNLTQNFFNSLVRAKKMGTDPLLYADAWAGRLMGSRFELLALLGNETPLRQIRRNFPVTDDFSSQVMLKQEHDLLQAAWVKNGGWNQLMAIPDEKELKNLPNALRKLMRDYQEVQGDTTLSFSFEEQQRYENLMRDFAPQLQEALQKALWSGLSLNAPMSESDFSESLLAWTEEQARLVLLSTDGVTQAKKYLADGTVVALTLPKFSASQELRSQVAETVSLLPSEANWKVKAIKEGLRDELRDILDTYLPGSSSLKYRELDPTAQQWRAYEQGLISTLTY